LIEQGIGRVGKELSQVPPEGANPDVRCVVKGLVFSHRRAGVFRNGPPFRLYYNPIRIEYKNRSFGLQVSGFGPKEQKLTRDLTIILNSERRGSWPQLSIRGPKSAIRNRLLIIAQIWGFQRVFLLGGLLLMAWEFWRSRNGVENGDDLWQGLN
jgi:hypothetical protein